jgi:ubiquinone/menaquinone biosynthesis C-methylase UbiE
MIELTPRLLRGIPRNGPTDPIDYYRRPLVGWLFRERINRGLRLLPPRRFASALEIGYAAGAVQLALASSVDDLHGLDLDADPEAARATLRAHGHTADLRRGSVYDLPYPDGRFELAVCFSVVEHLDRYDRALDEIARVLAPGGLFLLGMPAVNEAMRAAFLAIGFRQIEHHHITTPADAASRFSASGLRVQRTGHLTLPFGAPLGVRLYYCWLLEKI